MLYDTKNKMTNIFDLRRDFSLKSLDESDINKNPITFFEQWFNEAVEANVYEPNAMNLSTATLDGKPSARIVLLKQIQSEGFVFFTNYSSKKGEQIALNPYIALTFVWHELERQVRIEGKVEKIADLESDSYFEMRPEKSKLGAWASPQSRVIPNRKYLENLMKDFDLKFIGKTISRPKNWGGYIVKPYLIEFWQGRENRLHDRIQYIKDSDKDNWKTVRLAP